MYPTGGKTAFPDTSAISTDLTWCDPPSIDAVKDTDNFDSGPIRVTSTIAVNIDTGTYKVWCAGEQTYCQFHVNDKG